MPRSKNISLAINLLMIVVGMTALAYASVPLYRLFCEVTGYGGTTREGKTAPGHNGLAHTMRVTFNADTDPGLAWSFHPGERQKQVIIGDQMITHYVAKNLTNEPLTGHATFNVVPHAAGQYFVKIDCFCFTEQRLAANQEVNMPVVFYIDPAILDDPEMKRVKTITLSYTFFPTKNK